MMQRYRYETYLLTTLLLAALAFSYKTAQSRRIEETNRLQAIQLVKVKEAAELKRLWGNKDIAKKVEALKRQLPKTKTDWEKKGKRVYIRLKELTADELNAAVTKLLNLPVQIESMNISAHDKKYDMEFRCKW